MAFRLAQSEDIPSIMEIIRQAQAYLKSQSIDQWQDGYPNESVIAEDIAAENSYLLSLDGKVVGTAAVVFGTEPTYQAIYEGQWLSSQPYATIHRIAVCDSQKGLGLGGKILTHTEEICLEKGVHSLRVDTHQKNSSMQRLLQKHGFSYCGIIYLENGASRVAYEKLI